MHVALLHVRRTGVRHPSVFWEAIPVETEEDLGTRIKKLQTDSNTLQICIYRPAEVLTREVTFVSSSPCPQPNARSS